MAIDIVKFPTMVDLAIALLNYQRLLIMKVNLSDLKWSPTSRLQKPKNWVVNQVGSKDIHPGDPGPVTESLGICIVVPSGFASNCGEAAKPQ